MSELIREANHLQIHLERLGAIIHTHYYYLEEGLSQFDCHAKAKQYDTICMLNRCLFDYKINKDTLIFLYEESKLYLHYADNSVTEMKHHMEEMKTIKNNLAALICENKNTMEIYKNGLSTQLSACNNQKDKSFISELIQKINVLIDSFNRSHNLGLFARKGSEITNLAFNENKDYVSKIGR